MLQVSSNCSLKTHYFVSVVSLDAAGAGHQGSNARKGKNQNWDKNERRFQGVRD